jgi:hypothetical protein
MLAVVAAVAAFLPKPGMYIAFTLAVAAVTAGGVSYRRSSRRSAARLAGATGIVVGGFAVALAVVRYVLTQAMLGRLEQVLH